MFGEWEEKKRERGPFSLTNQTSVLFFFSLSSLCPVPLCALSPSHLSVDMSGVAKVLKAIEGRRWERVEEMVREEDGPSSLLNTITTYYDCSLFQYSLKYGCPVSLIKWMVREGGADPLIISEDGDTSMHYACQCDEEDEFDNSVKVVDFLAECGVDAAKKKGDRGRLPSHLAAYRGNVPALRRLIEHFGVSADAADDYGATHLHCAAFNGSGDAIPYLAVNAQASIHAKNKVRCLSPIPLFSSLTSSPASPIITGRRHCS